MGLWMLPAQRSVAIAVNAGAALVYSAPVMDAFAAGTEHRE
jgi:hypothetical protein